MAERKSKAKAEAEPVEVEDVEPADLGDAAATGEHAYAGERSDDVAFTRDEEGQPGTAAHLGSESPYAGSVEAA